MSDDFRKFRTEEDLKEKILSSVSQAFTGEETNRWMVALQEESAGKAEEPVVTGSSDNKLNENMASVVDRLFDNFKRYAFEFNRSLEHREHVVNCERPSSMRSQADYSDMGGQPIRFCIGHISSRDWALLVQAEENRVRAFITPIKFLVGFRPDQSDFEPYVELLLVRDRVGNSRQMIWTIDGQALALESIPALSRRFFGQLVKVTRGEASSTERFVFDPNDLSTLQPEVVVERSYEPDDQAMFFSEKPRPSELVRKAVADRPGHTLAQLANVGQGQGIMPQSGPNASIHAAKSADTDLLGQTQAERSNSPSHAAGHANSQAVGISSNSANQFASPAAAPRQLSISPLPPPSPNSNSNTSSQREELAEEPIPTTAQREELSFFSKAVQEPKEEAIKPAEREIIGETVEPKVEVAREPMPKEAAPKEPVAKEPEPTPVPSKPEPKQEIEAPAKAEPEPKLVDKVSATAAAIASQATTQTLSSAGVNGEKSTYHFVARLEEDETQKIDLNTDKDIAENNRRVAHAIKNLFDSVDTSITALTTVGVDAMKADDIAAVSSIMRQTKTLKVLRDGIVQLSKDWQKSLEN
ncbi:hypothetical protein KBI23_11360 [bacterium]|nr:hypothetical protein [bacterium]MBP9809196.1 hypothetical protein [bacterium]